MIGVGGSLFLIQPLLNLIPTPFDPSKEEIVFERWTNKESSPKMFLIPEDAYIHYLDGSKTISKQEIQVPPGQFIELSYPKKPSFVLLGPLEGIGLTFRLAFWVGLALSSPFACFFLFQFFKPGLYLDEQKMAFPFALSALFLGALGVFFSFFLLTPLANAYLIPFNLALGHNLWSLSHYFDYLFLLTCASVITFEMGNLLFWLVHLRVLSHAQLVSFRRHAILLAFILGALFTPPDVATQALVALLLICLYEGALLYASLCKKLTTENTEGIQYSRY